MGCNPRGRGFQVCSGVIFVSKMYDVFSNRISPWTSGRHQKEMEKSYITMLFCINSFYVILKMCVCVCVLCFCGSGPGTSVLGIYAEVKGNLRYRTISGTFHVCRRQGLSSSWNCTTWKSLPGPWASRTVSASQPHLDDRSAPTKVPGSKLRSLCLHKASTYWLSLVSSHSVPLFADCLIKRNNISKLPDN